MKNLKNYTKAELISKLNSIKQPNNNKESIFTNFMTLIMLLKSLLLKITLIAFIIKIFRKYSIFRKIFTIINTILFSIFGFSLIDFYEIDALSKYFHKIMDIFANFHSSILDLFGKKVEKVDLPTKNEILRGISKETNGIQTNNENNNGIIERYKKIIHGEEVKPEIIQEVIQEEKTPYYKNKYVIIAGLLMLSGITWYFYDEIKPFGTSILAWINISRSWSNSDPDDSNESISRNNQSNNKSLKDRVWEKIYGKPKDGGDNIPPIKPSNTSNTSIGLDEKLKTSKLEQYYPEISKGKGIDLNNYSLSELERRGIKPSIIELDSTTINFRNECYRVLNNILIIQDSNENAQIDKDILKVAYFKEKDNLLKLSEINPDLYQQFSNLSFHKIVLSNFESMEKDFFPEDVKHLNTDNYQEAEIAANQEKDVWSDRGSSPQQVLSPQLMAETAMETINKERDIPPIIIQNIEKVVEKLKTEETIITEKAITPKERLDTFLNNWKEKIWENKNDGVIGPITIKTEDIIPEEDEIFPEDPKTDIIQIQLTDNDLDQKVKEVAKETLLFIKDTSKPSEGINIINTTTKQSTPEEMDEYFKKEDKITKAEETKEVPKTNSLFSNVFEDIRNKRFKKSPNIATVGLPREDLSPLILNQASTSNLPDTDKDIEENNTQQETEKLPLHNWKEEIKLEIQNGKPYERFIDFDFGEHIRDIRKIIIITNDGQNNMVNPLTSISHNHKASIKWDIKGSSNSYWRDLEIYSITIFDKNSASETIYQNSNVKFLDNFNENIYSNFK
jgi:hypothetical protein